MAEPYAQITDHAAQLAAKVVSALRERTRIAALLAALGAEVQALDDTLWALLVDTRLAVAADDALDRYGRLIREDRGGLADDDYRALLTAAFRARASQGRPDDLIRVAQGLAETGGDDTEPVRYEQSGVAACILWIVRETPLADELAAALARLLETAIPAGVGVTAIEGAAPFCFSSADDPSTPAHATGGGFDVGHLSRVC